MLDKKQLEKLNEIFIQEIVPVLEEKPDMVEKFMSKVEDFEKEVFPLVEFEKIKTEEHDEFYIQGMNQRSMSIFENEILDYENVEQVQEFVENNYYSDTKLMFEYDSLTFPNTYVLVELPDETIENNGEDDVWFRERTKLEILSLKEFKIMLIKQITNFE